jgi:glutamate formiminotransferase/formiminotetrahydrofolate cyclodeaminase
MPGEMIEQTFRQLVEQTAARTPTPGGGAVAALSASLGAALLLMVVRFSRGKKKNEAREDDLAAAEQHLQAQLDRLLPVAERDCAAFDRVSAAYKLPKEGPEQEQLRARAIDEAMLGAMMVPEELICMARDAMAAVAPVTDCVSANIISDLGAGAEMLRAAAQAALLNVRINAGFLVDRKVAAAALQRAAAVRDEIREHYRAIGEVVEKALAQ